MSRRRPYLLAYDIADPRRLARIARIVSRSALRIQYSVYMAELTPARLRDLVAKLRPVIDPKADDLRIYPLPARIDAVWYGRPTWPDGMQFEGQAWVRLTGSDAPGYRGASGIATGHVPMTNSADPENSADRRFSSLKIEKKSAPAVRKQT